MTALFPTFHPLPLRGASTSQNCLRSGDPSYQSNWASLLKDTLGLNVMRFFSGGNGDVFHTNMVTNPNTWHTNLTNLLNLVGDAGMRCTYYCLGDEWGGGYGIRDPSYPGYMDINTAKTYIDKLAGDNPLGYNFITDPRIYVWSVSNEVNLGTGTSTSFTPNAECAWTIEMCDHIRSKGGKVVVPYARANDSWEGCFEETEPILRGHVDYLETHQYGIWHLVNLFKTPTGYNWSAWENWMHLVLSDDVNNLGSFPLDKMILGEFGLWRGSGTQMGLTNYTFTDQDRLDYYTHAFNVINDLGIKNVLFHYSLEENSQYWDGYCRYGMITPVPDGTHFTGPAGQPYPGASIIRANNLIY